MTMRLAMTSDEAREHFKCLGLAKAYRPCQEPESAAILLKVRRPAQIVDGRLQGSEIDLYDDETFRIWTARKKRARALAKRYGLRVRLLDGEAELFVPAALADTILPAFGAKTRRDLTPEQLEAARLRMKQVRNGPNLQKDPVKNEVPAIEGPGVAPITPPNPETPGFSGLNPLPGVGQGLP